MNCHYCEKDCNGDAFEQGNLIVIAHKDCAIEKVEKDGRLHSI
ncbi:hypothetical protein ACH0B6_19205 [Solibacillus silvestris]